MMHPKAMAAAYLYAQFGDFIVSVNNYDYILISVIFINEIFYNIFINDKIFYINDYNDIIYIIFINDDHIIFCNNYLLYFCYH